MGVPLGTNPLILLDLGTVLAISWTVTWAALLMLQLVLGGDVDSSHFRGAATVANYLTLVFLALFVIICFLIMRNRYAALYRFDPEGIFCDNMRANPRARDGRWIHFRGYPIEPDVQPIRSAERHAYWEDVTKVQPVEEMKVILLKGRRGVLMRVYCPDDAVYAQALEYAETHRCKD